MPIVRYRSTVPVPADAVFTWHLRPGAFERLAPPWQSVEVAFKDGDIHDGDQLAFDVKLGPARVRWLAEHSGFIENSQFRDSQLNGPFKRWVHTHRFHDLGDGQSILDDCIDYELPLNPWSQNAVGRLAAHEVRRMFRFRHLRTRNDIMRHWKFRTFSRLRVGIIGYSRVANQLAAFLSGGGHDIVREGPVDFVIDVTSLQSRTQRLQTDLRPSSGWISVLPLEAPGTDALRWPRQVQIRTPVIVSDQLPDILATTLSTVRELAIDTRTRLREHSWIAEDDLIGVIHHVLMSGSSADEITVRAPSFASELALIKAVGKNSKQFQGQPEADAFGYRYLYPTLESALAARSGRL